MLMEDGVREIVNGVVEEIVQTQCGWRIEECGRSRPVLYEFASAVKMTANPIRQLQSKTRMNMDGEAGPAGEVGVTGGVRLVATRLMNPAQQARANEEEVWRRWRQKYTRID